MNIHKIYNLHQLLLSIFNKVQKLPSELLLSEQQSRFIIDSKYSLVKWKNNYYNGKFEIYSYKSNEVFMSDDLNEILKKIKEWDKYAKTN